MHPLSFSCSSSTSFFYYCVVLFLSLSLLIMTGASLPPDKWLPIILTCEQWRSGASSINREQRVRRKRNLWSKIHSALVAWHTQDCNLSDSRRANALSGHHRWQSISRSENCKKRVCVAWYGSEWKTGTKGDSKRKERPGEQAVERIAVTGKVRLFCF